MFYTLGNDLVHSNCVTCLRVVALKEKGHYVIWQTWAKNHEAKLPKVKWKLMNDIVGDKI